MELNKARQLVKIINKYFVYIFLVFGILSVLFVFINTGSNYSGKTPISKLGSLDLTKWNFDKNGVARLNGEWEFYYEKLLDYEDFHDSSNGAALSGYMKVPGKWKNFNTKDGKIKAGSFGTYRLKVQLNKEAVNETLGIHIPYTLMAYKIIINGKQLAYKESKMNKTAEFVENKNVFFTAGQSSVEIIIQVTSMVSFDGGTHLPLYIGRHGDIMTKEKNDLLREMMLFTCLIIMGLYHVLLQMFLKKMKYILYFGLMCLSVALRSAFLNEAMLAGQFLKVSFSSYQFFNLPMGLLCIIFFGGFIYELYPKETSSRISKSIQVACITLATVTVLLPYSIYVKLTNIDNVVLVISALYYLYVIIRVFLHKQEGYKLMMFAIVIMVVTSVSDVLAISFNNYSVLYGMTTLGTIIFVFAIALLLSRIYANAFLSVDNLSKKLLLLDKLKDEFLANTSHELRTPLNGIIGIAESLVEGAAGETSDEVKENLSIISASGKRLSNLINDILDYSKLKHSDINLMFKPVDFYQLTNIIMTVFVMSKQNDKVVLKNEIPVDLPYVHADEARLQQIMYNLLGNAVKFTEEGEISVKTRVLHNYIEITIKDTGIGIPKDKQEDIFKSYEQIQESEEGNYSGTGLGLAISKKLVELHGGSIRCESVPGQGSSFIFTLHLSEYEYNFEKADNKSGTGKQLAFDHILSNANMDVDSEKAKILVVDDEPVNIQVLVNHLSLENYYVITATNGQTALELVNEMDFDLIMLDAMMPKMSGYEVSKKIREKYSLIDLPILMLTANSQLNNTCFAFECGINDYVTKPFEKQELLARINTLVTMKKAVKQSIRDPLTGIYNKRHVFELGELIFEEHRSENKHMAVIMMDIDNFKVVNDTYGHAEGDKILIEIAAECKKVIRVTDIFGRYGGEEFFVILPNITLEDALKLAERIRENIFERIILSDDGKEIRVTISLGVSTNNKTTTSIEQLMKEADKAMYKAKRNGKNRVEM